MANTPSEIFTLWRKAVPMHRARIAFAPAELKERWNALQKQSAIDAMNKGMADAQAKGQSGVEAIQTILAGSQSILAARTEVESACERILLAHIRNGHLRSFGFEPPRTVSSEPFEIDVDYWRGERRWSTGELRAQSLRFVEVRLLPAKRAATIAAAIAPETPRPGRPTVVPDIKAAFAALLKAGQIDLKAPKRAHYPAIRDWLRAHRPGVADRPDTPGDETIRRVIAPLIEAARSGGSPIP